MFARWVTMSTKCRPTGPGPCPRSRRRRRRRVPLRPRCRRSRREPASPRRKQAGRTDSASGFGSVGARAGRPEAETSRSSASSRSRPRSPPSPWAWRSPRRRPPGGARAEEADARPGTPEESGRAGGLGRGRGGEDGGRYGIAPQADPQPTASQEEGGVSVDPTGSHAARLVFRAPRRRGRPGPRGHDAAIHARRHDDRRTHRGDRGLPRTRRPRVARLPGPAARAKRGACSVRRARGTCTSPTASTGAPTWSVGRRATRARCSCARSSRWKAWRP